VLVREDLFARDVLNLLLIELLIPFKSCIHGIISLVQIFIYIESGIFLININALLVEWTLKVLFKVRNTQLFRYSVV